jgi:hypothetical protein
MEQSMTSMDFQTCASEHDDKTREKAALIVPLDTLLKEVDDAEDSRTSHRHSATVTQDDSVAGRTLTRKQVVGFIATLVIVASFVWYLFLGNGVAIQQTQNYSGTATGSSASVAASAQDSVGQTQRGADLKDSFRDNSHAVKTTLGEGEWTVGEDIPRGRYIITAAQGTGNISSIKANGDRGINEIFSANPHTGLRVRTVTTDLEKGEVITIQNLGKVAFIPAPTELTTTLSAGTWVTGFDVPAGTYTATAADSREQGTLSVWVDGKAIKNEIIGRIGDTGERSIPSPSPMGKPSAFAD